MSLLHRMECALAPNRLPPLPEMKQVGTEPAKPVWAIGFLTATSPEVCRQQAEAAQQAYRTLPLNLARIPWC